MSESWNLITDISHFMTSYKAYITRNNLCYDQWHNNVQVAMFLIYITFTFVFTTFEESINTFTNKRAFSVYTVRVFRTIMRICIICAFINISATVTSCPSSFTRACTCIGIARVRVAFFACTSLATVNAKRSWLTCCK
jgi:hypothetical protein